MQVSHDADTQSHQDWIYLKAYAHDCPDSNKKAESHVLFCKLPIRVFMYVYCTEDVYEIGVR